MSLPRFLLDILEKQYGNEKLLEIIEGYNDKRYVTFRANTLKTDFIEVEKKLDELQIEYEKVAWSKEAFIVKNIKENDLRKLDIYKVGEIYLQSLSSMLPPIILKPKEEADILDMTAAPGGKTTQMAALSKNKSHITACEMNKIRLEKLKYNIEKQGATCVFIMQKDSRQIDDFFSFDQILLDAPCSGSGTLENDSKNEQFTPKLLEKSIKSQEALLKKAIKVLKPGGELVYSTCSIISRENEEILKKVLNKTNTKIVPIEIEGIEQIPRLPTSIEGTICVKPNKRYEGFFVAKIIKDNG